MGKFILFRVGSAIVGIATCCVLLEIGLHWFPVNEGLQVLPVNAESPIPRFTPDRTSIWSRTWNFSIVNIVKTNNYGFLSHCDYHPEATSPLLALIGDSYVEAARIPWEQTAAARLQQMLGEKWRIYAFGMSSAPLSQYLQYAGYVAQEFQADRLVILVIGNDFDESLLKYNDRPGGYYFADNQKGKLELQRVDYDISRWRKLVRRSKLGMYLATNLYLFQRLRSIRHFFRTDTAFVGNTPAVSGNARLADSKRAVDAFLLQLPERSQLPSEHILLAIDGIRPQLYQQDGLASVNDSYFAIMRRYFLEKARQAGFVVLDLQPIFMTHYQRYGQHFEFPDDAHWNALGHQVFAESVVQAFHGGAFN